MPLYRVEWLIDIDAETPLDAAREALAIHRDPESTAVVFRVARVLDDTTGEIAEGSELIDLTARGRTPSAARARRIGNAARPRLAGYHVHIASAPAAVSWHATRAEAESEAAIYPASARARVVPL